MRHAVSRLAQQCERFRVPSSFLGKCSLIATGTAGTVVLGAAACYLLYRGVSYLGRRSKPWKPMFSPRTKHLLDRVMTHTLLTGIGAAFAYSTYAEWQKFPAKKNICQAMVHGRNVGFLAVGTSVCALLQYAFYHASQAEEHREKTSPRVQ